MLDFDGTRKERRRDAAIAVGAMVLALFLLLMPRAYQEPIRVGIRRSILSPFLAAQTRIAERRARGADISVIRAQRDSLAAVAAAEAALAEENARLRAALALRERMGPRFLSAQILELGTAANEGTFMVDVGSADGVVVGSPVLAPEGLLGVVWEVDPHRAQALDWSHPEFRVSAMSADGTVYGIVEARRGRFREEDMLTLTGAPFHSDLAPGTRIVTSGRGGLYPRGVPIGTIVGIQEADTGWRKLYLVRPAVRPESVLHAFVGRGDGPAPDLSDIFQVGGGHDSSVATPPAGEGTR